MAAVVSKKKKSRPSAMEYVAKMDIPEGRRQWLVAVAAQFDAKDFLPTIGEVRRFCGAYGVDPPASTTRSNVIPREDDMVQRGCAALILIAVALASAPAAGQVPSAEPAPRTPWGDPDLQGQWNSQTSTPLERPAAGPLAGRETLPLEEAAAIEATNRANFDLPPPEGSVGNYNAFWRDVGRALPRTSLIIDPPDGRIPPLSAEGRARIEAERAERSTRGPSNSPDTYADLSPWTRCISRGWNGIGSWYSSNYQIFQTPGYVVVFQELIHEPRIIPLDGRPHLPASVTQWMGDSRGRWDGDTLVVETTNFDPKTSFQGSRDTLHLTERYTRVDADTIDYRFTVDDPRTFTRPWTVSRPMNRISDRVSIYEYACHEGNYSMAGILAGARAEERAAGAEPSR